MFVYFKFSLTVITFPVIRKSFESCKVIFIHTFFMVDFRTGKTLDKFVFGRLIIIDIFKALFTKNLLLQWFLVRISLTIFLLLRFLCFWFWWSFLRLLFIRRIFAFWVWFRWARLLKYKKSYNWKLFTCIFRCLGLWFFGFSLLSFVGSVFLFGLWHCRCLSAIFRTGGVLFTRSLKGFIWTLFMIFFKINRTLSFSQPSSIGIELAFWSLDLIWWRIRLNFFLNQQLLLFSLEPFLFVFLLFSQRLNVIDLNSDLPYSG